MVLQHSLIFIDETGNTTYATETFDYPTPSWSLIRDHEGIKTKAFPHVRLI